MCDACMHGQHVDVCIDARVRPRGQLAPLELLDVRYDCVVDLWSGAPQLHEIFVPERSNHSILINRVVGPLLQLTVAT